MTTEREREGGGGGAGEVEGSPFISVNGPSKEQCERVYSPTVYLLVPDGSTVLHV